MPKTNPWHGDGPVPVPPVPRRTQRSATLPGCAILYNIYLRYTALYDKVAHLRGDLLETTRKTARLSRAIAITLLFCDRDRELLCFNLIPAGLGPGLGQTAPNPSCLASMN